MEQDSAPRRVLVVDDHQDSRTMLRMILNSSGHDVMEAADGLAGVNVAIEHRPDLAIIDIGLPELDGYEVAQRLRANELTKDMVLVALTGYSHDEDRQRALAAGFDLHLTKPIGLTELQEVLLQVA